VEIAGSNPAGVASATSNAMRPISNAR